MGSTVLGVSFNSCNIFEIKLIDGLRINAHPNLGFTVILNPDSGPGALPYPNGDFFPQIQRLNQYSNVDVVGYVHTSYGTRNITNVLADVATYSAWAANSSSIELSGIFFDEAPSEYSSDMATYMSTIDQAVKNAVGLQQRTVSNRTLPLVDKLHDIPLPSVYSIEWHKITAID